MSPSEDRAADTMADFAIGCAAGGTGGQFSSQHGGLPSSIPPGPRANTEVPGLAPARLWAASRFPYLATGLFGAEVVAEAGSGTVRVDERWRLRADPALAGTWTAAELGSVLVHHLCHLLRGHADRAGLAGVGPADRDVWIRAADAEINDDLIPAGLSLPGSPVVPASFGAPDGRLAEEYYSRLQSAPDAAARFASWRAEDPIEGPATPAEAMEGRRPSPRVLGGRVAPQRRGAGGPPRGGMGGSAASHGGSKGAGAPWEVWLDCGSGADGQPRDGDGEGGLDAWQADLLRRQVAEEVSRAGKEPGTVPGGLLRWAGELLSPKVNWRRLLTAELRRAVADVAGATDYSYRRPSRRADAVPGVVLPALRRPVPEIVVVCDTSGSMTADLLTMALSEVEGLLRGLGLARRVRVLACDTAVAAAQRVTSASEVALVGGGGTDVGAGINAAYALRPRPAVCVVLTDGYTPWPQTAPKGMRVVSGLLGAGAPAAPDWVRSVRVTAD